MIEMKTLRSISAEQHLPAYGIVLNDNNEGPSNGPDANKRKMKSLSKLSAVCLGICAALLVLFVVKVAVILLHRSESNDTKPIITSDHLISYNEAEALFLEMPSEEKSKVWMRNFTSSLSLAGTDEGYAMALWVEKQWKTFGMPFVNMTTYYPLLNFPKDQRVSVVGENIDLTLAEDVIAADPDSGESSVPAFHGYSADGNVTGPLIFAGLGRLEDFELLKQEGIDLNGSIALVFYGSLFRGLKVRAAEMYGCAGVLIASNPSDDGYVRGPVYPDGPWRPESSLQRGSVHYNALYPGDPTTPGYPSTKNAEHIPQEVAKALPKIPSIPISWRDCKVLLEQLNGTGVELALEQQVDEDGLALPQFDVSSWSGNGTVIVNMVNENEWLTPPVYNVFARIEGAEESDRSVIIGAHRDAWVYGAADPHSGSTVLMELARAFGKLHEQGWRPRRTVILASWDAEEYGIIGSTEWVEEFYEMLNATCVSYINLDNAVTGNKFQVQATPVLSDFIRDITKLVNDPRSSNTTLLFNSSSLTVEETTFSPLYNRWFNETKKWTSADAFDRDEAYVGELGSGSDYVSFLDFVGIASVDVRFRGPYGVYHSVYDSFHWMESFGDPGFKYHKTLTQVTGLMAMRIVDDLLLPWNYTAYANALQTYIGQLEKRVLNYNSSFLFESCRESIGNLYEAAANIYEEIDKVYYGNATLNDIRALNDRLIFAERQFLDPQGITGRSWYKHVVFAPGLWAGYGAATFPSLTEAIDAFLASKNPDSSSAEWRHMMAVETRLANFINNVAKYLSGK